MNPLWLLLIVPATAMFSLVIVSLLWASDDSDERKISLLMRQYNELRAVSDYDAASLLARHERERREFAE